MKNVLNNLKDTAKNEFFAAVQKLKREADIELIKKRRVLDITDKLNAMRGNMTSSEWVIFIYAVMKELNFVNFYEDGQMDLRALRDSLDGAFASRIKAEFEREMELIDKEIRDYERQISEH